MYCVLCSAIINKTCINFQYDTLPQLNLPGKKAFNSISPDILEKRKIGFNAYLQVGGSIL